MAYNSSTNSWDKFSTPAYGTTVTIDASAGAAHKIVVTNTTAFAVAAPLNPSSLNDVLAIDILNSSGGVMGAITWNAIFKLAGAFTNPANGKRRTIMFYWDGTNWVETGRAAADI